MDTGEIWRSNTNGNEFVYPSCNMLHLGSGLLIGHSLPAKAMFVDDIYFQSYCLNGNPTYMTGTLHRIPGTYLDSVMDDWAQYLSRTDPNTGSFQHSIMPMIISFTANFVITFALTILAFLNVSDKPYIYASRLLKLGATIASINIAVSLAKLMKMLNDEYTNLGIIEKYFMISLFRINTLFVTLDFLSIFILQCCQTFILMRIFERNQEKRIIFFVGISLAIISNILWILPRYHQIIYGLTEEDENNNWELLPPFVYMFKIVIAASYASLIINFIIRRRKFCYKNLQLTILTFLTIISVLLLPAFFIADVTNYLISEITELFNTTCYVGSTFIVWEWLERLSVIQKREQAQSILGRAIYEDEQQNYTFARYALKVQDALSRKESVSKYEYGSSSNTIMSGYSADDINTTRRTMESDFDLDLSQPKSLKTINSDSKEGPSDNQSVNRIRFNTKRSYIDIAHEKIDNTLNNIIYFTDHIILKKLGARSSGGSSSSSTNSKERKELVRKRIGLDITNKVYVYSTKEVNFESDDEESWSGYGRA